MAKRCDLCHQPLPPDAYGAWCDTCHAALAVHAELMRTAAPVKDKVESPERTTRLELYRERAGQRVGLFR